MGSGESGADCEETVQRLYTYLDGELTDERRAEIKKHLDDCSPCLQAFDFEAELRIVIASKCKDHVPEHLIVRVREVIAEEERRSTG
ncbi:MAG TPA: mycothiol system anti-sigma-R factor [Acidimicrobiales bacterium]|nr:mycothiol system anti-sigma-R factor [Acidimicrobiales bacterium]